MMTNKQSSCNCLVPYFSCCLFVQQQQQEDDEKRRRQELHSKKIDKQIAKDKKEFIQTVRVLLLGAGESGKSTIIKQMQLIHNEKFSDAMRIQRRDDIRNNLLDSILSILEAMGTICPPVEYDNAEHEAMAKWVIENAKGKDFELSTKFYDFTKMLWKDTGVQAAFLRSNEYQLIDSAKYFLEKIDAIRRDDYVPSDHDILRCRVLTTGITDVTFQIMPNVRLKIVDVGGQRDERRKWFLCFNDVTSIIFVVACSSYDMVLREDSKKNRLRESLELFRIIWNNKWLKHISVIVFLNKQDLFEEKILSARSKISDYFPDYKDFPTAIEANCHPEVSKGKQFIENEFKKISYIDNNTVDHMCYSHFTCAIDTENIKRVFRVCRNQIQVRYFLEYELL